MHAEIFRERLLDQSWNIVGPRRERNMLVLCDDILRAYMQAPENAVPAR